ncbi:hypothetical protein [Polaribacter sp.]|uniref:hypothetical protein n=1 Tax=Polaribacter sp. TaxID=1920175 RepID=UPI003F6CE421
MKQILIILSIIVLFSCKPKEVKLKKPSFLIGNWVQVNRMDSLRTYETWHQDYSGVGLTLDKKDTTFFEKMNIIQQNDSLFLTVSGVNATKTYFKFTNQTDSSFTAENPKNEFPKKITYSFENGVLKADVSNDDYSLFFVFEKIEK